MKKTWRRVLLAVFCIANSGMAFAQGAKADVFWQSVPSSSRLTFLVHWESSTITGDFPEFDCLLETTKADLPRSLKVLIATRFVHFTSSLLEGPARSSVWFDVKRYPQAVFTSRNFHRVAPDEYQATGDLTLKGVRHEVSIRFELTSPRAGVLFMIGKGQVRRQDFDIGSGTWKKSTVIGSRVIFHFHVSYVPKP